MTRDIFIILSSLLLSFTFLTVLFARTDPSELASPYRALMFLFIGGLALTVVASLELLRALVARRPVVYQRTIRRGGILGLLAVTLLYLSSQRLLGFWNVIPLVLAGLLIEIYAHSRLLPQKWVKP